MQHNNGDMTVEELGLSCRAYNCLKNGGIDTVGDAWRVLEGDPRRRAGREFTFLHNCGKVSSAEIYRALSSVGRPADQDVFDSVACVAVMES